MMFKFALRNVFRNTRRSLLTGLAIFFASIIVVFSMGYMNGMLNMMTDNFTKFDTGDVKVTTEGYAEREKFFPVDELIPNSDNLMKKIRGIEEVRSVEERVRFGILLGREKKTVAAFGMGLDIENTALDMKNHIIEGEMRPSGLYIGHKLAKKLNAEIGDELLLATNTSEGGLNGMKFRVNGLVKMQVTTLDEKFFFIYLNDAKKLLKMRDSASEIYVYSEHSDMGTVKKQILPLLSEEQTARTARDQVGTLWDVLGMYKYILFFFEILIMFLASFVVINTMMQSIFERMAEIGALKALGMTDKEIATDFVLEGGIIGALGGIPGAAFGYLITLWINRVGINVESVMSGMEFPVNYIIRPDANIGYLIYTLIIAVIVPAVAAYYPARYAKKLSAAEALRKL